MKTFLVLFVGIVLILGILEANATRLHLEDRKLLSDANVVQKDKLGANDKGVAGNKGAERTTSNKKIDSTIDGDVNENYKNYGQDSSDDKVVAGNKGAEQTTSDKKIDSTTDGDVNENYKNYGQDSSDDSHHQFSQQFSPGSGGGTRDKN